MFVQRRPRAVARYVDFSWNSAPDPDDARELDRLGTQIPEPARAVGNDRVEPSGDSFELWGWLHLSTMGTTLPTWRKHTPDREQPPARWLSFARQPQLDAPA